VVALAEKDHARVAVRDIDNGAVRSHPVGRHLADMSTLANVDIRILRFHVGIPLGAALPPFTILDFVRDGRGKTAEPPVIYCENYTGAAYLERRADVLRFREAFAMLQQAGPDARPSRDLLREIAREFDRER
jgi:hypothetical protein